MKAICLVLLTTGYLYAQTPGAPARRFHRTGEPTVRDSVPSVLPPDLMPSARPSNSFYRSATDPKNVVRATLDNMPVKVPDSSTYYTMLRSGQRYRTFLPPTPGKPRRRN